MIGSPELEDELGDVLEKAMKMTGQREDVLAARTGIDVNRIKDALDYRYEFASPEITALAEALNLNETGLRALADGRYPEPSPCGLPFCMRVLAMPYGVGVVNAYIVGLCESDEAILIDSGSCPRALGRVWPEEVKRLAGHFVTHWDPDHAGGCRETMERFHLPCCMGPGPTRAEVCVLRDRQSIEMAGLRVDVLSTPGPAQEHFCYLVSRPDKPGAQRVLFSGDLFFCGSVGGGFFDGASVLRHARRMWRDLPAETLVAPGHGPLTSIGTEREFNPFSAT